VNVDPGAASSRMWWKSFSGTNRSSLLGIFVSDEEKQFHNTGARLRTPKIRYLS